MRGIKVVPIIVTTDATGAASVDSPDVVSGEILKIVYDKGTVDAATTVVTKTKQNLTGNVQEQIDSYDVNTASAIRYLRPCDNDLILFAIHDHLNISVSGGAASKTFAIRVYYR